MREIKFKFLLENGEVTEPYYLKELIDSDAYINIECEYSSKIKQELQYTGLKDKNGVEIYEGDILDTVNGNTQVVYNGVGFEPFVGSMDEYYDVPYRYEVIGNIYEDSHLLDNN